MSLPTFKNRVLEQSTDLFKQTFTFAELDAAGVKFKEIHNKGKGRFIVAKFGDDVMSIPCGKSVTEEHSTKDCMFGLTEDNTLVAYTGVSAGWVN